MSNFIVSIAGKARSGKDSICQAFIKQLADNGILAKRYAFADELKKELDPLILFNFGISAFTEDEEEKKLIRPLLVTYGTELWRKVDLDHWIKKVEAAIKNDPRPHVACVSDTRFPNESNWCIKNGGYLLHIDRLDETGQKIPPASEDERIYDEVLYLDSHYRFEWPTYGINDPKIEQEGRKLCDELFSGYYSEWREKFLIDV